MDSGKTTNKDQTLDGGLMTNTLPLAFGSSYR
jgi:hypothetical protein